MNKQNKNDYSPLPAIEMDYKNCLRVYTGAVHLPGQFSREKYVGQLWLIKCLVRSVFTSAPAPTRSGSLSWLSEPQPPRGVTARHRTGLGVAAVYLTTWKTWQIITLVVFFSSVSSSILFQFLPHQGNLLCLGSPQYLSLLYLYEDAVVAVPTNPKTTLLVPLYGKEIRTSGSS